nr:thymidine phosphorylase [Rubrivivax pictus]
MTMLAVQVIQTKRDGGQLSPDEIQAFVDGVAKDTWSEGQVAAMAMAIFLRGMQRDEIVALTRAMLHSGDVMRWEGASALPGPVLDKHSTGGVGDKVSLMLAPIIAVCGGVVPMVSGRGLGHTGGTLDKLEAIPGYRIDPPPDELLRILREVGCAIVGASARIAPADRRLYGIRDVTGTVESIPLITASILSKKLSAGLQSLVIDVKVGNGAFADSLPMAQALATSLVQVAQAAGLPTEALLTDMNQTLGFTAGNALELVETLDFLDGTAQEPRLLEVTLQLAARMLRLAGLQPTHDAAYAAARDALTSGRAAERFARMVAALGGPADVFAAGRALPPAPVQRDFGAPRDGVLAAMNTRAIGHAIVALGGGRRRASDVIDARVGFSHCRPLGTVLKAGEPLLRIHAASDAAADEAAATLARCLTIADSAPALSPVIVEAITG